MIIALLISLFLLLGMPMMGQNPTIALPADGDWPTIVGDSIMLIGPRQNELTEEQRYFNPPYLLIYPGKEHLTAQMIRATLCDCDPTKPNRRIGVFSVAPDKQVSFSQGNLQYLPAANIWKFADTQYEYLGNANKYLTPTFRNWVDLFGWSANNTTAPFGVSTSPNAADYAGDFVDWGTNEICGDAPGTWRTLSKEEWEYLLNGRENAEQLRTKGSVEGKEGVILLPDNWICPEGYTIAIIPDEANLQSNVNTYSQADWSKLEAAGAIILPSAGMRRNATELEVRHPNIFGGYWTCTNKDEHNSYCYTFHTQDCEYMDYSNHIYGRSVRLVHDTIVSTPEPEYVDLGLSVKWATFNVGATAPEDYGDYFAWGETEPKETYSWKTYKWGTSSNLTKYNTTDGKTILDPEDDAAQVHWGGKWRMPTKAEYQELIDSCTWEWTTSNNINGYRVTGPNGHSIFLPAGGVRINDVSYAIDEFGYYWSSSHMIDSISEAHSIVFTPTSNSCDSDWLSRGRKIRPVYDNRPPKRIGVFSVAADKQVSFSQGNLQYTQSTDEWRFAREQYEYIGAENIKDGKLADKIDLFGWSADNTTAPFGVSTSTNDADYTGEFVDWGTNTICGEAPGTWRTLSADEWEYLLKKRKNASDLYGVAQVASVNGMIILPDDWEEANGIVFKSGLHSSQVNDYSVYQSFTDAQWLAMENAGAVFLPALGYQDGTNVEKCDTSGYYWSNTTSDEKSAYRLYFYSYFLAPNDVHDKYRGRSVRLVHDTIVQKVEPEYVDLGLSVKWATFNVGATSPEDYGDYFAWGETEPKEEYTWENYKWCDGTANTFTKYCSNSQYGNADYKTILDPEDDAAIVHWGSDWRMPTIDEWLELKQNCTWKKITINGITGCQVTAKNGNSIFLPRAGLRRSDILYANDSVGYYASSSHLPEFSHEDYASYMLMYDSSISKSSTVRYYGLSIRPVYDEVPDPCLVVKVNDTLSINLMCVEGGTFMMGAMEGDTQANANEKPAHEVTLTYDYHIMQTEVTQGLWEVVMGEDIYDLISKSPTPTAKPISTKGNFPVGYVQLSQCLEFIDRLNALTGLHFRMPTEAEWEYAARGGNQSKGYLYAGSNDITQVAQTSLGTVAKLRPNELGIYDMSGNIAEMTLDYLPNHDTGYPSANAQVNPRQISPMGNRAIRGLRWNTTEINCRISHRNAYTTTYSGNGMGFRLVLSEEQDFRTIHVNGSYFDMSFVKGGTFMMGSDAGDAEADEQPVHEVTLSDYYIGQTEVTQHLWKKVMGSSNNPSATKGDELPVTNITWDEAQTFVERLSELTGMHFRLPTEAEWEYAARGGQKSKGYTYAGSDDIDEVGWYSGNSGNTPHAVGQKQPNELGIYDMTGNVYEWCHDWYGAYSPEPQTNPQGPNSSSIGYRIVRGGCWQVQTHGKPDSHYCRIANRGHDINGNERIGLRIVLVPEKN